MIPKITALAIISVLTAPAISFAQGVNGAATLGSPVGSPTAGSPGAGTTGVSGIPPGPGNVGGNNNSVYDPSGVGNASRIPPPRTTGSATGTPGH